MTDNNTTRIIQNLELNITIAMGDYSQTHDIKYIVAALEAQAQINLINNKEL